MRANTHSSISRALEGGCQVPIGAFATLEEDTVHLKGLVGAIDGSEIIEQSISGPQDEAEALGKVLADKLLSLGADKILKQVYDQA